MGVTNEYPYEECQNASQIYRRVIDSVLPEAFKKVEDEKVKAIINSCIDSDPKKRATVQQLLENDFFDDRELNVLLVGREGNALKLRLVVLGSMTKRMPEDEAIDFTFTLGVDTSHSVA